MPHPACLSRALHYGLGNLAVLLLTLAGAPGLLAAIGPAHLVADLDPRLVLEDPRSPRGVDPAGFTALGDKVVFTADSPTTGPEPWVTDGTALGTFQLADLCPGRCSYAAPFVGATERVAFFVVNNQELWRTDGTVAGTFRLLQSLPYPFGGLIARGLLFFAYSDEARGLELWRSDGTAAGTAPVVDLILGNAGILPGILAAGSRVIFDAFDATGTRALWSTDGTAAGTRKLVDHVGIELGLSTPGRAFFLGRTLLDGFELFVSDGTVAGTRRLTDFTPFFPFSTSSLLPDPSGGVLFFADDGIHGIEIFVTDGVSAHRRLSDTPNGPRSVAAVGSRVVFTALDGLGSVVLWSSNGKALAEPIAGGCPQGCPEVASKTRLTSAGTYVVFAGSDAAGEEPWRTDGTAAGTRRLADIAPGPADSAMSGAQLHLGRVFFTAGREFDFELWSTDGTPAGTRRISSFADPDPVRQRDGAELRAMAAGGRLFFVAADPTWGLQPWVTDGTLAGTRMVTVLAPDGIGSHPRALGAIAGGAALLAYDGEAMRLYRTDGSPEGTSVLLDPQPLDRFALARGSQVFFLQGGFDDPSLWRVGSDGGAPTRLASLGNRSFNFTRRFYPWGDSGVAFLTGAAAGGGLELWTSDGTLAGTRSIDLPGELVHPGDLFAVGNRLYFTSLGTGEPLWTTDGSEAGLVQLLPTVSSAEGFVLLGAVTYFLSGGSLWRTDGTPEGTTPVWDNPGGPIFGIASDLVTAAGALYFFASTEPLGLGRRALWRSDGTTGGTHPVVDLPGVAGGGVAAELTAAGSRLYFAATDAAHGRELWRSDGTAAGTSLVRDLAPGTSWSFPEQLTPTPDGSLFFIADDGPHGFELWHTDGTAAGTRMVQDVGPGSFSSYPEQLVLSAGQLFFTADDGLHGRELWALSLASGPACTPAAARLCLGGGRYQVEARWRAHDGTTGVGMATPLTTDTGAFWFFDAGNLEVVIKVLEASGVNGHRWVFYGALSDVEYTLTVTDTSTGAVRRYFNPSGMLASVGDTSAFGPLGATGAPSTVVARAGLPPERSRATVAPKATCSPTSKRLCFADGRFAVSVAWQDFAGNVGTGMAMPLAGDTGAFWFFGAANVELLIKILDGRPLNDSWWVYFGALSNVAYTVTVTDTATGRVVEYRNPSGRFASVADTSAFPD